MTLTVREMMDAEVDLIIDYFLNATPEYLETLGVDRRAFLRRKPGATGCTAKANCPTTSAAWWP